MVFGISQNESIISTKVFGLSNVLVICLLRTNEAKFMSQPSTYYRVLCSIRSMKQQIKHRLQKLSDSVVNFLSQNKIVNSNGTFTKRVRLALDLF